MAATVSTRRMIFLGGNGHCAARLVPARKAINRLIGAGQIESLEIIEVLYPGFEGRPPSTSLKSFLSSVTESTIEASREHPGSWFLYGTGIGGLLALCLRAEGVVCDVPLLLQAPVLWGLEHRLLPRLMRHPLQRRLSTHLFRHMFSAHLFQSYFTARYFESVPAPALRNAFFAGYAQCASSADLFAWLNPALLRRLEILFARHPERLERISVWWGTRDRVVSLQELKSTERSLGGHWPLQTFAHWGHYPMLDDPYGWVKALGV